jgi:hypothetical protein
VVLVSVPYHRIKGRMTRPAIACVLCGRVTDYPVIDHCHAHGYTRGVVCTPCNARLGHVDAAPDTATKEEAFHRDNCPNCRRISGGLVVTPAPKTQPMPPRRVPTPRKPRGKHLATRGTYVPSWLVGPPSMPRVTWGHGVLSERPSILSGTSDVAAGQDMYGSYL